jgi:hypothetical protein
VTEVFVWPNWHNGAIGRHDFLRHQTVAGFARAGGARMLNLSSLPMPRVGAFACSQPERSNAPGRLPTDKKDTLDAE